jgi:hypothetical protein
MILSSSRIVLNLFSALSLFCEFGGPGFSEIGFFDLIDDKSIIFISFF